MSLTWYLGTKLYDNDYRTVELMAATTYSVRYGHNTSTVQWAGIITPVYD